MAKETAVALGVAGAAALAVSFEIDTAMTTRIGRRGEAVGVGRTSSGEGIGEGIEGAEFEIVVDALEGDDIGIGSGDGLHHGRHA